MKTLFTILTLLLIGGCSNEANSLSKSTGSDNLAYTAEELLGKTVGEYEDYIQEKETDQQTQAAEVPKEPVLKNGFLQLSWQHLVAPGYDAQAILKKYEPLVIELEEGSAEALKLFEKMDHEFNNAPPNKALANKKVSIPGFLAPLEQVDGLITEFLLVPYFGACIHNPPPPANQTVHVKVAPSFEIKAENAYDPFWISGELLIEMSNTEIGNASYKINNATISKYNMDK